MIKTERLIIRQPLHADLDELFPAMKETATDLINMDSDFPSQVTRAYTRDYLNHMIKDDDRYLVFQGLTLVGEIGFHPFNKFGGGYWFHFWCRKPFQNRGIITEALRAVITGIHGNVLMGVYDRNKACLRVMEKLKMHRLQSMLGHQGMATIFTSRGI